MAERSVQTVAFEKVTRGNGKLFISTRTPDYMWEYGMTATAVTADGDPVPASMVSCTILGCCVVTMPILDVAQECVLMCQGVEVARKTFRPLICQLESALHAWQNDVQAQLIRNWDRQLCRTGCSVYASRVVRARKPGVCIVQGAIRSSSVLQRHKALLAIRRREPFQRRGRTPAKRLGDCRLVVGADWWRSPQLAEDSHGRERKA